MGLFSKLFGAKTFTHQDERLGMLTAKLDKNNTESSCFWQGEKMLLGQEQSTSFYLEGTSAGPNKSQVIALHKLLDDLPEIVEKLDTALQTEVEFIKKYGSDWAKSFYLLDISIEDEFENTFLIGLTNLNEETETDIDFEWRGRQIVNLEIDMY